MDETRTRYECHFYVYWPFQLRAQRRMNWLANQLVMDTLSIKMMRTGKVTYCVSVMVCGRTQLVGAFRNIVQSWYRKRLHERTAP